MVCIRQATPADLILMQTSNLWCLPENYQLKYYMYHILAWPQLLHVAENHKGEIVGYVLAKMEDDANPPHGHITSLAVLRTHRKCGLATKLMQQAHARMQEAFGSTYCSLHVRYTNVAAFHLYSVTLGYRIDDIEKGYYADGEDAYSMKMEFSKEKQIPKNLELEEADRLELEKALSADTSAGCSSIQSLEAAASKLSIHSTGKKLKKKKGSNIEGSTGARGVDGTDGGVDEEETGPSVNKDDNLKNID